MGFPLGDAISAIIVSIMICKVALDILKKSIRELMDSSAPPETINSLRQYIESVPGVKGIDSLKTRIHGNKIYADVEIRVDKSISVSEGMTLLKKLDDYSQYEEYQRDNGTHPSLLKIILFVFLY